MSILEKLLKEKIDLDEKLAKEKAKIEAEEDRLLQKEFKIRKENNEAEKIYQNENFEYGLGKTPVVRLLMLIQRFNQQGNTYDIPYIDPILSTPKPKRIPIDDAIKEMGLSKFAELINSNSPPAKELHLKKEKYDTLKKSINKRRSAL